jgi:hypothetical protein
MAINPNNGVLDIINGTLKVSSIDIKQAAGFTTALNTVARNDVLLFDDQKATTVFTPTSEGGYMSSTGVTRDTTEGAGYIDLNDGWVYWPLQLPNSWHTEFDMHVTTTGGVLTYSLFNTSEPNHTDYTNNDGGYKIVFDNTNNQIDIYWEGSIHKTVGANLRSSDWQHVNINYFQGAISVSLAGKVVLTHEFTQNYQEFNSRYVGFSATAGASHKIRHLRVHNSDKWLYTKTSNASDITYVSGNVGIGSLSPTELLDVHGNVHIARDLTVDGNLTVSGTTTFIDTQNLAIEDPIIEVARGNASDTIDAGLVITRATSNVAVAYRGDEEELALGYTQSGASDTDVTPIADGGLDVRVYGNLFANNLTTTANVEATYLKGDGSELTHVTLDQVVGYGNVTSNTIQLAGLTATGNVEANYFVGDGSKLTGLVTDLQSVTDNGNTTSNTVQFTNATTAFVADSNVGIGTDAPSANLHVVGHQYVNDPPTIANSFDHSDAPLTLTHGTPTSTTAFDDPKAVLHLTRDGTDGESYGARASFNLSRYENSGTASRSRLDVALTDGTYTESTVMTLRADGKVGIGTTTPGYTLDVNGTANVGALTATTISGPLTGNATTATTLQTARTIGGVSFDGSGNINLPGVNTTGNQNTSGNAATATKLATARTIGGVSFDGSGNISLPGVNTTGNQNTSGNAATATTLQTARTIGGVSFDGSGNINLPGVNTAGNQNTSGNAATATTATNQSGGTVNATLVTTTTNGGAVRLVGTDHGYIEYYPAGLSSRKAWLGFGTPNGIDFSIQNDYDGNVLIPNGNVGIGTTNPQDKLHIYGTDSQLFQIQNTNDTARMVLNGASGTGGDLIFRQNGTSTWGIASIGDKLHFLGDDSTSQYRMTLDNSGNVGIGNTNPAFPLTIGSSDGNKIQFNESSTPGHNITTSSGWQFNFNAGRASQDDDAKIAFNISGSSGYDEMMRVTHTGVGIGTASPGYKLDVDGEVRTGNVLYIGKSTNDETAKTIYFGGTSGDNSYDHCVIERRVYTTGTEKQELLLFSGNDKEGGSGPDRIRLKGSNIVFDTYDTATIDRVTETTKMIIRANGNVGIGTTSPDYPLTINTGDVKTIDGSTYTPFIRMTRNANHNWTMASNNTDTWNGNLYWFANINDSGAGYPLKMVIMFENDQSKGTKVNGNTFTGQHRNMIKGIPHTQIINFIGLIVSANSNKYLKLNGEVVNNSDAITINEAVPIVELSTVQYDKKCFGVISGSEDPESRTDTYGRVTSIFTREQGDVRTFVNSLGEGAIWVTNINGPLESGDYITTSNVPGYGMKQDPEFLANYTVAKITMDCDFNPPTQYIQQIVKETSNVNYYRNTSDIILNEKEYSNLTEEQKEEYTLEVREELTNVLDEYGQLQWEDTEETEKAYKIRYLTVDGQITDEANAVHIAAFVGCTYHCG